MTSKTDLNPVKPTAKEWLETAYAENLPWFERYVAKNSGTSQEAKDIFQDSLSVAWINLRNGKFVGIESDFTAYVRQICKYKWMDELKRKGRFGHSLDLSGVEEPQVESGELEEAFGDLDVLHRSMSSLGDKCKTILNSFYFLKQSLQELSQSIGVTDQSVKTMKYRCMNRLRAAYLQLINTHEEA
ncbi:sigma-70 family RNA polymerase sigma factor [Algoriphagus sp. H41]|uniref:Sigma-70 family RNA polymerase sigma factor n=1 Tax=Algoriphagus oliviformis TaxID=2811231 RepID=A0ABS3C1R4_9BACT|nr:sigma-70 family RNA polymerase sigma factor [Algoriphagus oliviformis]MBN7810888.1 sigma-70 family RNA polymerase sigma factor [Algoriphagus oliviformis]